MTCPKCGAEIMEGSSFCVKCGANLSETPMEEVKEEVSEVKEETVVEQSNVVENTTPNTTPETPTPTPNNNDQKKVDVEALKGSAKGYLNYILALFTKPFSAYKDQESKFNNTKDALMFSGFIALLMMVVNLVLSVIIVPTDFGLKYKFGFRDITGDLLFSLIVKKLIIYVGALAFVALVYYLGCLIIKKSANYVKLLSIVSTAAVPYIAFKMALYDILLVLWRDMTGFASWAGTISEILLMVLLINDYTKLEKKDSMFLFHVACLTIIRAGGMILLTHISL